MRPLICIRSVLIFDFLSFVNSKAISNIYMTLFLIYGVNNNSWMLSTFFLFHIFLLCILFSATMTSSLSVSFFLLKSFFFLFRHFRPSNVLSDFFNEFFIESNDHNPSLNIFGDLWKIFAFVNQSFIQIFIIYVKLLFVFIK